MPVGNHNVLVQGFFINFLQVPNCFNQNAEGPNAQNRPAPPRDFGPVGVEIRKKGGIRCGPSLKVSDFV